jgi:transposase-like protein
VRPRRSRTSAERPGSNIRQKIKIRIVLDGLRGEETIAELCRREGIAQSIYYISEVPASTLLGLFFCAKQKSKTAKFDYWNSTNQTT